mgnify:CR=1 FL=1
MEIGSVVLWNLIAKVIYYFVPYRERVEFLLIHGPRGLANMETVPLQSKLPVMVSMNILAKRKFQLLILEITQIINAELLS